MYFKEEGSMYLLHALSRANISFHCDHRQKRKSHVREQMSEKLCPKSCGFTKIMIMVSD